MRLDLLARMHVLLERTLVETSLTAGKDAVAGRTSARLIESDGQ